MLQYHAQTIKHSAQRYNTCGDYFTSNGVKEFRISEMGNKKYEFLVLIHEMIEEFLCSMRDINEPDITEFDCMFEAERNKGLHSLSDEPGNDKRAPYRKEHKFATKIERLISKELGISWKDYEKVVESL